MSVWQVEVHWEKQYEAEDEGDAMMQAEMDFSFMHEGEAYEIEEDD